MYPDAPRFLSFLLLNNIMLIGKRGDLRQVGNAEHLMTAAKGLQLPAHGLGGAASDAGINFVEDQGACPGFRLSVTRTSSMRRFVGLHGSLEGQHHSRHFPARSNLFDGMERLTGVGGNKVGGLIEAVG